MTSSLHINAISYRIYATSIIFGQACAYEYTGVGCVCLRVCVYMCVCVCVCVCARV